MAWIRCGILGLIGCLIMVGVQHVTGAGESSAPYIYYYANTINTIVVERADGTDSRVIAPGAMLAGSSVIKDLEWSASGEWMAWRGSVYSGYGTTWSRAGVVRSDGSDRLTLLDGLSPIGTLLWSPTDDFLFVAYSPESRTSIRFMIVDVNANKIIAHTDYENERLRTYIEGFQNGWLADGSGVYFTLPFEKATLFGQLSLTNEVTTRIFTPWLGQDGLLDITKGRMLSYDFFYADTDDARLTMRDLSSGEEVLIDSQWLYSLDQNQRGFRVAWDPTMRYALIFYWQCDIGAHCYNSTSSQVYLLDWEHKRLQFLADRIDPRGNEYEMIMDYPKSVIWSPDGRYAVLRDTRNHLMIVDAVLGQLSPSIDLPDVIAWQWAIEASSLILLSDSNYQLYQYDLQQQSIFPLNLSATWFSISSDMHHLGLMWSQMNADMINLKTDATLGWARHTSAAGPIVSYLWDEGSQWFMTGDYTTLAGGGSGQSAVTIHDTTSTVRRELGVCGYLGSCAGFVPERIVPHLGEGSPTSVIPEPESTLQAGSYIGSLAWSPDGTKLASFNGDLTIWDMVGMPELISIFQNALPAFQIDPASPSLAWSLDGRSVLLKREVAEATWDIETGNHSIVRTRRYWPPTRKDPTRVIPSPDRRFVVYARSFQSDITIVDSRTQMTVATLASERARRIVWSEDGQMLFIVNANGSVTIWEPDTTRIINERSGDFSVAIDTRHKMTFGASVHRRIRIWDAVTGDQLTDVNWSANVIALSPDGTRLAAAGSSLVTLWDVRDLTKKDP